MKNYGKRIAEYMPWLLLTGCVEGICILFLALADVQVLQVLAGVLTLMTVLMYAGVCIYIVKKEQKKEEAFALFLNEPEEKTAEQFFTGLFHEKLAAVWLKFTKIKKEKLCGDFTDADIQRLSWMIKEFKSPVIKTNSYEQAQICCGGVNTTQINPETMESRLVPGLYFAGELIDVDAICGGYNLTWAWASGYVAGQSAASA